MQNIKGTKSIASSPETIVNLSAAIKTIKKKTDPNAIIKTIKPEKKLLEKTIPIKNNKTKKIHEEVVGEKALEAKISGVDDQEKICTLCARNRPVFVVDTDNMIKRMPERHLSPLLKNIKKDFNN